MAIDMTRKFPRPEGHHTVTPGFAVEKAAKVLDFLVNAFGAKIVEKYDGPNGTVAHAEVMIGDSGKDHPAHPAGFSLYVDNGEAVDRTFKRALDCGAKELMPIKNQ